MSVSLTELIVQTDPSGYGEEYSDSVRLPEWENLIYKILSVCLNNQMSDSNFSMILGTIEKALAREVRGFHAKEVSTIPIISDSLERMLLMLSDGNIPELFEQMTKRFNYRDEILRRDGVMNAIKEINLPIPLKKPSLTAEDSRIDLPPQHPRVSPHGDS